jgi:putative transcriptional regulator
MLCKHNNQVDRQYLSVDIHNRIAVFRAERGTSRRELADAVGVNSQTIGYLERGDYNPSLELAMKIAAYFNVAVDHLFSFQPFESVAAALRLADAQGIAVTTPAEPIAAAAHRGDA